MMTVVIRMLLAASDSWTASIVAKATVTAALAFTAVWLAPRGRAATRHAALAAAFAVLLLLPLASVLAPPVRIAVAARVAADAPASPGDDAPAATAARHTAGDTPTVPAARSFSLSTILTALWGLGLSLSLLPLALSCWKVRQLCRSAHPWRAGQPTMHNLARDAGIRRNVALLLQDDAPGPMTCGVLHPAIVLPSDAPSWAEDDLNRALMHELEHVRRYDWASHCLARIACAVYWFHPLVWAAWLRLGLEAERACDDAVLRRSEPTAYAGQLLDLARRLTLYAHTQHLGMASRKDLARRIRAMLDGRQRRGRAGTVAIAAVFAAAAVVVFTVSPLRMVAASQAAAMEFSAVSVKLINSDDGEHHSDEHDSPGRLEMGGNLHRFIIRAYGITDGQLGGEPEWFKRYLYEIDAASDGRTTTPEKMVMLRAALADRFQLKLRQEEREVPVYDLTVAPGGPKFHALAPNERLPEDRAEPGIYHRYYMTMEALTNALNRVYGGPLMIDRTVIDHTNLTGSYNAHLRTRRVSEPDENGHVTTFPDLVRDLQTQMGLKLTPAKAKIPYYVVEHASPAKPN